LDSEDFYNGTCPKHRTKPIKTTMNPAQSAYPSTFLTAAQANPDQRAAFIRRTYAHLALAILAFTGVEAWLLNSSLAESLIPLMLGHRFSWLIVIGCFMGVSMLANGLAQSRGNPGMQYVGLGLFVVAEAVVFLPMIYIAIGITGSPEIVQTAGIITLMLVAGLTATVFITRADFSFMGNILGIGFFIVIGLVVAGMLFGFSLGLWFSVLMVGFAAGSILYETSNILHRYSTEDHVAASLGLFASVALLFWYILQILLSFTSRD
jgi:FtsH-binding integral membrane protein